jgi:hypothetical protein
MRMFKGMLNIKNQDESIVSGLFMTMAILLFHVLLLAAICLLVLFFHIIVNYLLWIIGGILVLAVGGGYLFLRYLRGAGGEALRDVLTSPDFKGRSVEVNLFGGLASLKIGKSNESMEQLPDFTIPPDRRIEDENAIRTRELLTLARLLEQNLISKEEYLQAKKELFN